MTITNLITEWQTARARLAEIERREHPDIIDSHGRAWTWIGRGDVYCHDGAAFAEHWLREGRIGLPSQRVLDNPNYGHLCDTCLNGRTRNVPDCKPEWNCSHLMHQPAGQGSEFRGAA